METVDPYNQIKYIQTFSNNMRTTGKPKLTKFKSKPYTKITFTPDLERFGMNRLDTDIVGLMKKRAYDMTAFTNSEVAIYLNKNKIKINTFEKYVKMYTGKTKTAYEKVSDRWEIAACVSPDDKFEHTSFVNGIYTFKGGKHVDYVANQICRKVLKKMKSGKKKKDFKNMKTSHIKDNLWIFVKSTIVNPAFGSQTKDELTTILSNLDSKCDISDKFIDTICKTDIVKKAQMLCSYKQKTAIKKDDGKKE